MMYILLIGMPPFYDSDRNKMYKQIKQGLYEFDQPEWESISDEAKDLITRLLVVDPKMRIT